MAICYMVDSDFSTNFIIQFHQATDNVDQVILGQDAFALWRREVKLTIKLIATDATKIVATRVKKEIFHQRTSIIDGGRIARTHFFVQLEKGLVFSFHGVAIKRSLDIACIG